MAVPVVVCIRMVSIRGRNGDWRLSGNVTAFAHSGKMARMHKLCIYVLSRVVMCYAVRFRRPNSPGCVRARVGIVSRLPGHRGGDLDRGRVEHPGTPAGRVQRDAHQGVDDGPAPVDAQPVPHGAHILGAD